jgi:hypothetical protein
VYRLGRPRSSPRPAFPGGASLLGLRRHWAPTSVRPTKIRGLAGNGSRPGQEIHRTALRRRRSRLSRCSVGSTRDRDRLGPRYLTTIHRGDSGEQNVGGDRSDASGFRPCPPRRCCGPGKQKLGRKYFSHMVTTSSSASARWRQIFSISEAGLRGWPGQARP